LNEVKDDDGKHHLSRDDQEKIRTIMLQLDREARTSVERDDGHTRASGRLRKRLIALTALGAGMVLFLGVGVIAREFSHGPRRVLAGGPHAPSAQEASRRSSEPSAAAAPDPPRTVAVPIPEQSPTAAVPIPEQPPTAAVPTDAVGPSGRETRNPTLDISPPRPEPPVEGQDSFTKRRGTRSTSAAGTRPKPPVSNEPAPSHLSSATETWILWAQEEGREAQTHGWQAKAVLSAQSWCDKAMRDEIQRAKNAFIAAHGAGYTVGDAHGRSGWGGFHEDKGTTYVDLGVTYQCLPGTDPRAPRGT
jgi:hypothetical protein